MGKFSSLLRLRPFIKKHRILFIVGLVGMILSSIISVPIPYMIGYLTDKALITKQGYSIFYKYIIIIAIMYLLRYIVAIISKYIFVKISNFVVNEIRFSVISKVIDLPMNFLSSMPKGYIEARISECSSIGDIFSPRIVSVALGIFDGLLAIIAMSAINYKLALIVLLCCISFFIISKKSSKVFLINTKKMMESNAILNGNTFEIINGIEDIKILNGKENSLFNFKNKLHEVIGCSIKQSKSLLVFTSNMELLNQISSVLILLVCGIMILKGHFTVGLYASFSLYSANILGNVQTLATVDTIIKPVCLSIERMHEFLDKEDENSGRHEKLNENVESIGLINVSFKYNNKERNILENFNLKINKGEKVLIKGENGSGKSTIIKLLVGLYSPTCGKVCYNGLDLNKTNYRSIRSKIGIVSQNIFLFRGTVLDNILYGHVEKTRDDVEKVINHLGLVSYISKFPSGLDTEISQNTTGISGGQAQVIAFIRAMLDNKDVIILDEPISNVDAETTKVIIKMLKNMTDDRILIIISHINQHIDFVDKIINI